MCGVTSHPMFCNRHWVKLNNGFSIYEPDVGYLSDHVGRYSYCFAMPTAKLGHYWKISGRTEFRFCLQIPFMSYSLVEGTSFIIF